MDQRTKPKDAGSVPKSVVCALVWPGVFAVIIWLTWSIAPGSISAQADPNRQGVPAREEAQIFPGQHQSEEPTGFIELTEHEASNPAAYRADSVGQLKFTPVMEIGRWPRGGATAVTVDLGHKLAFLGYGSTIGIFNTSGVPKSSPTLLSILNLPDSVKSLFYARGRLYAATTANRVRIINVRNPARPFEEGSCGTPTPSSSTWETRSLYVAGRYAYFAAAAVGLQIINVSDPARPTTARIFETADSAQAVSVAGNYAYVAIGSAGLQIVDISDPARPKTAGFFKTAGYAGGVQVVRRYAYVSGDGYLRIIDVSDPTHPTEVGSCAVAASFRMHVAGKYAYGFGNLRWNHGLSITDVSDPAHPVYVGGSNMFELNETILDVYGVGPFVYISTDAGLRILNVTDPQHPREVYIFDAAGSTITGGSGMHVAGNFAYVVSPQDYYRYLTSYVSGLRIVDVKRPALPTEVAFLKFKGATGGVFIADNYAYVGLGAYVDIGCPRGCGDNGLKIINVSDPAHPVEVAFLDMVSRANGIRISGGYAYVFADGLRIVDVSDPAHPAEVGSYQTPTYGRSIYVAGSYAYLAEFDITDPTKGGVRTIDVSDPTRPSEVSFYQTGSSAYGIFVSGSYAYVATGVGLKIIEVNYAYVANPEIGLRIINVSDPTHPTVVGFFKGVEGASALYVCVAGKYVYVGYDPPNDPKTQYDLLEHPPYGISIINRFERTGAVSVKLKPQAAAATGGKWKLRGGRWLKSGATLAGITAGRHSIRFKQVPGWKTPRNETVIVGSGQTKTLKAQYLRH
jgi:hypothetical protein